MLTCKQHSSDALQAQVLVKKDLQVRGRMKAARGVGSGGRQEGATEKAKNAPIFMGFFGIVIQNLLSSPFWG